MNFTREPIIETIITPKEGYKLVIRNTKGREKEEFVVDAVEVVSFGHSFFFRSDERPKSFLVPVTDFEVVEAKETRVVLKNASFERAIKIGGGRDAPVKASKEKTSEEPAAAPESLEKKRERRRHRRRRPAASDEQKTTTTSEEGVKGGGQEGEQESSSSTVKRLIPPPPHLISEKIEKKEPEPAEAPEGDLSADTVEKKPAKKGRPRKKATPKEEAPSASEETPPPSGDAEELQRVGSPQEVTSTSFSTIEDKGKGSFFGKIW